MSKRTARKSKGVNTNWSCLILLCFFFPARVYDVLDVSNSDPLPPREIEIVANKEELLQSASSKTTETGSEKGPKKKAQKKGQREIIPSLSTGDETVFLPNGKRRHALQAEPDPDEPPVLPLRRR
jgi:hypothetical protein